MQHLDGGRSASAGVPVAADAAAPAPTSGGFLQQVGNTAAGLVRGAGSIGATLVDAARGLGAAAVDATLLCMRPAGAEQVLQEPRGAELRAGIDGGLQELGADPKSIAYQGGKLTSEVADTFPIGGILGKGAAGHGSGQRWLSHWCTGSDDAGRASGRHRTSGRWRRDLWRGDGGSSEPSQAVGGSTVGAVAPSAVRTVARGLDAAGRVTLAAGRGVRPAIEPFTQSGRQAIASRVLTQAAGDDAPAVAARLAQAGELVAGSVPTAAQVAENGGVAALERAMSAADPAPFTERGMEQSAARLAALRGIAGDESQRAAAVAARAQQTSPLYEAAAVKEVPIDTALMRLLQRPFMQKALDRARAIAAEDGRKFEFPRVERAHGSTIAEPKLQILDEAGNVLSDLGPKSAPRPLPAARCRTSRWRWMPC